MNQNIATHMENHWHKIVAMMMQRQGITRIEFTAADVERLAEGGQNQVVLNANDERILVILTDEAGAAGLVVKHAKDGKL